MNTGPRTSPERSPAAMRRLSRFPADRSRSYPRSSEAARFTAWRWAQNPPVMRTSCWVSGRSTTRAPGEGVAGPAGSAEPRRRGWVVTLQAFGDPVVRSVPAQVAGKTANRGVLVDDQQLGAHHLGQVLERVDAHCGAHDRVMRTACHQPRLGRRTEV